MPPLNITNKGVILPRRKPRFKIYCLFLQRPSDNSIRQTRCQSKVYKNIIRKFPQLKKEIYRVTLHAKGYAKDSCKNPTGYTIGSKCYREQAPDQVPTGITVTNIRATSAFLTWNQLELRDCQGQFLHYNIHYSDQNNNTHTIQSVNTSLYLTGLNRSTQYTVEISGESSTGKGHWSKRVFQTKTDYQMELILIIAVIPVSVMVVLCVITVCIKRYKRVICPVIPDLLHSSAINSMLNPTNTVWLVVYEEKDVADELIVVLSPQGDMDPTSSEDDTTALTSPRAEEEGERVEGEGEGEGEEGSTGGAWWESDNNLAFEYRQQMGAKAEPGEGSETKGSGEEEEEKEGEGEGDGEGGDGLVALWLQPYPGAGLRLEGNVSRCSPDRTSTARVRRRSQASPTNTACGHVANACLDIHQPQQPGQPVNNPWLSLASPGELQWDSVEGAWPASYSSRLTIASNRALVPQGSPISLEAIRQTQGGSSVSETTSGLREGETEGEGGEG
eukprot:gi/632962073/ref/XP_007897108.1/ PREDICTED: uncharacterized protein LOC103182062 isoform X2 [Callorhinchus milii]